jgi:hypothetical protein
VIIMNYLKPHRVTGYRETATPASYRGRADGYGSRIPMRAWLQLDGKSWHRVYAVCWGTGATMYINAGSTVQYLETGQLDGIVKRCGLIGYATHGAL